MRRAQGQGLKVCLKPMVNVADGTWRAYIGFFDWDVPGEPSWGEWFASYGEYIVHQARLAVGLDVDLFCIGCETVRADSQERCAVSSASGYYPSREWETQLDRIQAVVERERKPFCSLEAGCPSRKGAQARPNDWTLVGAPSEQVQADYLDEILTAAVAVRGWAASCCGTGPPSSTTRPRRRAMTTNASTASRPPASWLSTTGRPPHRSNAVLRSRVGPDRPGRRPV